MARVSTRIRKRRPELPILFATGYTDMKAIRQATGPDTPILRKPFRLDEHDAALRTALGKGTGTS